MGKQKKLVQRPMLYIAQPDFEPSKASMQETYHGKKEAKEAQEKAKGKASADVQKRSGSGQQVEGKDTGSKQAVENHEREAKQETQKNIKSGSARDRRQRFRDMTLEEKVTYFVNLPSQIPKMKCEVETEEGKLRGYINSYEDGIVHMKTFQRPFRKEINFEEIKDINLIGF